MQTGKVEANVQSQHRLSMAFESDSHARLAYCLHMSRQWSAHGARVFRTYMFLPQTVHSVLHALLYPLHNDFPLCFFHCLALRLHLHRASIFLVLSFEVLAGVMFRLFTIFAVVVVVVLGLGIPAFRQ